MIMTIEVVPNVDTLQKKVELVTWPKQNVKFSHRPSILINAENFNMHNKGYLYYLIRELFMLLYSTNKDNRGIIPYQKKPNFNDLKFWISNNITEFKSYSIPSDVLLQITKQFKMKEI